MKIPFGHDVVATATISEITDGNMRIAEQDLGAISPEREAARRKFLESAGMPTVLVTGILAHGSKVAVIRDGSVLYLPDTDALVTDVSGVSLGVTVADCVPVFFSDRKHHAIGIAHAGWRGVIAGVLENTIAAMIREYDSSPTDLRAYIGPHIRSCHFEVGSDVAERFPTDCRVVRDGKIFVDLGRACLERLTAAGVGRQDIGISDKCTFDAEARFFSFRRDRPVVPEAMLAAISF